MDWRDIVSENKHRLPLNLLKILEIVDLLMVVVSFGVATILIVHAQHRVSLAAFLAMRTKIWNFVIFLLTMAGYHLVFKMCGLYRSRRLSSRTAEVVDILKANTIADAYFRS